MKCFGGGLVYRSEKVLGLVRGRAGVGALTPGSHCSILSSSPPPTHLNLLLPFPPLLLITALPVAQAPTLEAFFFNSPLQNHRPSLLALPSEYIQIPTTSPRVVGSQLARPTVEAPSKFHLRTGGAATAFDPVQTSNQREPIKMCSASVQSFKKTVWQFLNLWPGDFLGQK